MDEDNTNHLRAGLYLLSSLLVMCAVLLTFDRLNLILEGQLSSAEAWIVMAPAAGLTTVILSIPLVGSRVVGHIAQSIQVFQAKGLSLDWLVWAFWIIVWVVITLALIVISLIVMIVPELLGMISVSRQPEALLGLGLVSLIIGLLTTVAIYIVFRKHGEWKEYTTLILSTTASS